MGMDPISRNQVQMQQIQPAQPKETEPAPSERRGGQGSDISVSSAPSSVNETAATYDGQQVVIPQQNGGNTGGNQSQSGEEQIKQENEKIMKAISEMNKKMVSNTEAVFGIHEDTNRITIKLVDKTTKETIKELPPEKTLDMIAKAWEMAGLLVDEKK